MKNSSRNFAKTNARNSLKTNAITWHVSIVRLKSLPIGWSKQKAKEQVTMFGKCLIDQKDLEALIVSRYLVGDYKDKIADLGHQLVTKKNWFKLSLSWRKIIYSTINFELLNSPEEFTDELQYNTVKDFRDWIKQNDKSLGADDK